ncbi:subtilisin-like protease SBT5.3 [Triticum urartu]|uniref:Subtilisin-like protease n=1 Tax=Triticum urartu TaxID=4572 RepID=A0A8R7VAQ8_TRIUA|nr:subtilisin-like protease SBT5.3 [Triticum urartu]XP_048547820.1 subtilisin-like protease SBT5.3 [Triticum urartu]
MAMETGTAAAAEPTRRLLLPLAVSFLLCALAAGTKPPPPSSSYIVYLGAHSHRAGVSAEEASTLATESHYDLLGSVLGDREKARDAIFYSYTKSINGFAAVLEPAVAAAIAKRPGVVSVFPNRGVRMQTTRSWEFMGLEKAGVVPQWSAWEVARYGGDTIIGNLDSGVWPESLSFNDGEMGPIPDTWKGICQNEHDPKFKCNSKLIGARYFNKGYAKEAGHPPADRLNTPRDDVGHGSHTLATAGGSQVNGAAAFGYGNGTARGGSPRARVAAYRVCFNPPVNDVECFDADILAAFEAAIADGVHVITASVGGEQKDFFEDTVAIGSLHATKAGITVVCSATNNGPDFGTVSNLAPWVITVAASTTDRAFPGYLVFNRTRVEGQSLSEASLRTKSFYPLIIATDAVAPGRTVEDAQVCMLDSLDAAKVTGKIVVCCVRGGVRRMEKGEAVRRAGGVGMVLVNDEEGGSNVIADAHVLPALHINYTDGLALLAYIKSTPSPPSGFISKATTIVGARPAPVMASFSSVGPNVLNPEILKPDVTAPGVAIIAPWSGMASPSDRPWDERRVDFTIQSGTSMSCPHVAGIAGLVKTLHPDWSPAAIKSAIMTTATDLDMEQRPILNPFLQPATPFSYGSGHVFPARALDPGLVYDASYRDYLNFFCALGYDATAMGRFNETRYACPAPPVAVRDLNYPSITLPDLAGLTTVRRRVRNVGAPRSTYTAAVVREPEGVQVNVTPATLAFAAVGEEKEFQVSFVARVPFVPAPKGAGGYGFGAIVWSDGPGNHRVRTPLAIRRRKL